MAARPKIRVHATPDALARAVADEIVTQSNAVLAEREFFSLVVSGGSTPVRLYATLALPQYRDRINWTGVELYFADERCVPIDSPLSNYHSVREQLLEKVPLPADNVYRMRGEIDPTEAARLYDLMLAEHFDDHGPDLVLLGMGEDGHTASLFPDTDALRVTDRRCVANHVPHDYLPPGTQWRLTLTAPFINRSSRVLVLITGSGKTRRVEQVLGNVDEKPISPIELIRPDFGELTYHLDAAAAGMDE